MRALMTVNLQRIPSLQQDKNYNAKQIDSKIKPISILKKADCFVSILKPMESYLITS